MMDDINTLLEKYDDIDILEKIIEMCQEKIKIKKYEKIMKYHNNFKFLKLNHEIISGTYDKYDRCNESYHQQNDFDIEYNNKVYNIFCQISEADDWWLAESNDSTLYIYEIAINSFPVAKFYGECVKKTTNINLFEIYKQNCDKLEIDYNFIKQIMDIIGFYTDYQPIFVDNDE